MIYEYRVYDAMPGNDARRRNLLNLIATSARQTPRSVLHRASVSSVAFSPDGTRVLTGSRDKTARVWDVATGKPVTPPLQHEDDVESVAFSPEQGAPPGGHRGHTAPRKC